MKALRPALLLGLVLALLCAGPSGRRGKETESLILPPYLDSVVFDLYDGAPGAAVEIFAPGDLLHPLAPGVSGAEEIRLGNVLKTLIIRRPAPGRWTFLKSPGTRVKILSQQFFPWGVLLEPARGARLRQHDRVSITYRVIDDNGFPLKELPGYPLNVQAILIQPGGPRRPVALERRPRLGPGIFQSREKTECPLPGRYWTELTLTTRDLNGRTVKLFQDRWSGFSVGPAPSHPTLP